MKSKPKQFLVLPRLCCNGDCKRVAVVAKKLSDFWITQCDQCDTVNLNSTSFAKIEAAREVEKKL